nr:hypothetical protein [Leptotrichia sp. OH3620_COT-345]
MESDKHEVLLKRKDGPSAISEEKYREGVEDAIKDILKRSINRRVQFGETTLLIPENTIINSKQRNIVDMKTGYGIFIIFSKEPRCIEKKEGNFKYGLMYSDTNSNIAKIAQKIIKVNGFKNTCN